ncbi:MAG TPA: CGNR zinc finger domain-containing protein [Pseudonocardia sp.]
MSETASGRYRIELAPDGLALVHDLVNTISAGRRRQPDLLETLELAQPWLTRTLSRWAVSAGVQNPPSLTLTEADLPRLRALRGRLRDRLRGTVADSTVADSTVGDSALAGSLRLALDATGEVRAHPEGDGVEWITSAVLGQLYLAQLRDTRRRLKLCRNERCGTAFYDRSRNNSGVWHDVRVCGNAANLRASRARRKNLG